MKDPQDFEKIVTQRLDEIKSVPPRDPKVASRGRAQFLGQAVSAYELQRQKGRKSIFRKERYAMNILLSVLVIAGLLFGGGAATVSAAQDDLPNEPLYGLKTWTEDFTLQFQNDGEEKVNRLMELSQVRVQEMVQLSKNGETIPEEVPLRLEQHIQLALQNCVNMDNATMERALLQIRTNLQTQSQEMEQLQLHAQEQLQLLTQTRTMLQQRLQLVDEGLTDPVMFRAEVQNGYTYRLEDEFNPPVQDGNGQQNGQPSEEPGGPVVEPPGPNSNPGNPNVEPTGPNGTPTDPSMDPGTNPYNGSGGNGMEGGNGSGGGGKP
jgi:hypothetical protein